jgi:hypothetical protein
MAFSKYKEECRRMLAQGGKAQVYSAAYLEDAGTHRAKHPTEMSRGARRSDSGKPAQLSRLLQKAT